MNLIKKVIFSTPNLKPNTFIGGIGQVIKTKEQLSADFINIEPIHIKSFKLIGNDISFHVARYYTMNYIYGQNESIKINYMTYFKQDRGGGLRSISHRSFYRGNKVEYLDINLVTNINESYSIGLLPMCKTLRFPDVTNIGPNTIARLQVCEKIIVPNLTSIAAGAISITPMLEGMDIKKCKNFGSNTQMSQVFVRVGDSKALGENSYLNVNSHLLTSNNGGVNASILQTKIDYPDCVISFYDDNGNYVSTL